MPAAAGAPPVKGAGAKGKGKGDKGKTKAPQGPPGTPLSIQDALKIFQEVVKRKDPYGKSPCLGLQIHGVCKIQNCPFSHAKGEGGKGLAVIITNHEKKACNLVLASKKADPIKKPPAKPPKTKKAHLKTKGEPSKKWGAHAMATPEAEDPKGKGKRGKGKGKTKDGKGKGKGKCTNCGSPDHAAEACPQPPQQPPQQT